MVCTPLLLVALELAVEGRSVQVLLAFFVAVVEVVADELVHIDCGPSQKASPLNRPGRSTSLLLWRAGDEMISIESPFLVMVLPLLAARLALLSGADSISGTCWLLFLIKDLVDTVPPTLLWYAFMLRMPLDISIEGVSVLDAGGGARWLRLTDSLRKRILSRSRQYMKGRFAT
jgi:hypothetical protein